LIPKTATDENKILLIASPYINCFQNKRTSACLLSLKIVRNGLPVLMVPMAGVNYAYINCYTMKGDTSIGGFDYKKINVFTDTIDMVWGTPNLSPQTLAGCMRYDSTLNELIIYNNTLGVEKIVYKFDLATGDNYVTSYTPFVGVPDSLISRTTDSTIDFTRYTSSNFLTGTAFFSRNVRYFLHQPFGWTTSQSAIINNIGDIKGFLQQNCTGEFESSKLQCFSDLGKGETPCFTSFELLTSLAEKENNNANFDIYPLPVTDILTLHIKGASISEKRMYSIYNLMGERIMEKSISDSETSINVEPLKPGVYFIQLNTENTYSVKKFIKQ
jgi:Secretion system C-terminal sorting domain